MLCLFVFLFSAFLHEAAASVDQNFSGRIYDSFLQKRIFLEKRNESGITYFCFTLLFFLFDVRICVFKFKIQITLTLHCKVCVEIKTFHLLLIRYYFYNPERAEPEHFTLYDKKAQPRERRNRSKKLKFRYIRTYFTRTFFSKLTKMFLLVLYYAVRFSDN